MDWLLRYADPNLDWSYAMTTLVVRFIGVFVVMATMQVALQTASFFVRKIEAPRPLAAKTTPLVESPEPFEISALTPSVPDVDRTVAAAIGLALELELRGAGPPPVPAGGGTSSWAMAGRVQQLQRMAR